MGEELSKKDTEALLVLVPKEPRPSSLKKFQPISLLYVQVKLASKMIVNRLKPLMRELVGPSQTSFILGRKSLDNVILCQELVHTLRFTKARQGGMIIKVDLEKAYDMMKWEFVKKTMRDAYIPQQIAKVVMNMLKKSTSRLLWNGEITDKIHHKRGLRQGDPLSPYLFVLCLERLGHWICRRVEDGVWKPLKASRGALKSPTSFSLTICYFLQRLLWSRSCV